MLFLFIPITPSAHQQESHLARDIAHHLSDKLLSDFFFISVFGSMMTSLTCVQPSKDVDSYIACGQYVYNLVTTRLELYSRESVHAKMESDSTSVEGREERREPGAAPSTAGELPGGPWPVASLLSASPTQPLASPAVAKDARKTAHDGPLEEATTVEKQGEPSYDEVLLEQLDWGSIEDEDGAFGQIGAITAPTADGEPDLPIK